MRHQLLGLWQHGSGAAAAWRVAVKHGPALMSWLSVITGFVGVAMCTIAILLL
jgi:hypothetical protein